MNTNNVARITERRGAIAEIQKNLRFFLACTHKADNNQKLYPFFDTESSSVLEYNVKKLWKIMHWECLFPYQQLCGDEEGQEGEPNHDASPVPLQKCSNVNNKKHVHETEPGFQGAKLYHLLSYSLRACIEAYSIPR